MKENSKNYSYILVAYASLKVFGFLFLEVFAFLKQEGLLKTSDWDRVI